MQIIAHIIQIVEVAYPLRGIEKNHKNEMKNAIQAHGHNNYLGILSEIPKEDVTNSGSLKHMFFEDGKGIKTLKTKHKAALVDGHYRWAAPKALTALQEEFDSKEHNLHVSVLTVQEDR